MARTHRRLTVLMGMAGLVAFAGGAGFEPLSSSLTGAALGLALFWQPTPRLSERMEKIWGPLALLLVVRALAHLFVFGGDVVVPVVDLLLLLLAAESLRSLDTANEVRIQALAFALLLASTAYRPGLLFAVGFVAFIGLASFALPLGLLRRKARRYGVADPGMDRAFFGISARLAGVTLGAAVLVFVAFPRVSRGWAGRGEALATTVAGFSDQISLGQHGSRILANPDIVLRVEFPDGAPASPASLHWRARSYDRFDGVRWTRSVGIRPSSAPVEWYRQRWPGPTLTQHIYSAPLDVRVLFGIHPIVGVEADARTQPMFDNVGDFFYWGASAPVYTVRSILGRPPADSLRTANAGFMPDRSRYLQLPRLPDRVGALADSLTRNELTRYDKAVAIERWLQSEFTYTRELPRTAGETSLDHFLFERLEGHCEYFSTSMVILLRSVGIHARNVNGFLGGRWNDFGKYLAVTQNEAHSWVEVWFPGYGWVEFDPTPGGTAGAGGSTEWLWPGRIFLDGLQHRWGKWVLDYSFDDQVGLAERIAGIFGRTGAAVDRDDADPASLPPWFWPGVLALVAAGAGALYLRRIPRRRSPETAVYLDLVQLARRSGAAGDGMVLPLRLVQQIRGFAPEAGEPAARLVGLYLRARFAGQTLSPLEARELRDTLARIRGILG